MAKKENTQSVTRTYNLKPIESNLLFYIKQHTEAIMSGVISSIAADRLSVNVTPRTQFELNNEFTEIKITELPEPPKEAPPEEVVKKAK